jgi:hypothetical protein
MFTQVKKNVFKLIVENKSVLTEENHPIFSIASQSKYIVDKNIDISSIIFDYTGTVQGGENENHEHLTYELLNHFKPTLKEYGVILNLLKIYNVKKFSGFHIGGNLYLKNTPISGTTSAKDIKNSLPYLSGDVII